MLSMSCRTKAESRRKRPTRLALHRGDGGDDRATGHDRAVHLHPLTGGWGGGVPGPHLTRLQVGKLDDTTRVVNIRTARFKKIRNMKRISLCLLILVCEGLTSVVSDPATPSSVMSANVCSPSGCFFTRSKGTVT